MLLKEFENFKNHLIQTLFHYCLTQKKVTYYLKNNYNKNKNNCNYQAFIYYETFHSNSNLVNKYIESINYYFSNSFVEKGDIESNSRIFIKLIDNFKSKKNIFSIKKEEIIKKINEMEKLAIDDHQEVTSFASFNNGKNIIFGLKKGIIKIYDFKKNLSKIESFNLRLKIEEFNNDIKHLCDLDKNLFAASDENNIKIFEYRNNNPDYILIQNLKSNSKIYSMINLPTLSQKNNKNYFCISDKENISIYMADKPLQNKDNRFSIIKSIAINYQIYCMIEADGNYIIASCSPRKSIKFFDINDEFKEKSESEIKSIKVMAGNNTMTIIPNKKC